MKVIGKSYRSVSEMVHDTDPEVADAFDEHLAERRIIKQLVVHRVVKGLSQKDIAQRMRCTQSRISKLESSTDGELSIDEIRSYAAAVGLKLSVVFTDVQTSPNSRPRGERIAKRRTPSATRK